MGERSDMGKHHMLVDNLKSPKATYTPFIPLFYGLLKMMSSSQLPICISKIPLPQGYWHSPYV